MKDCGFTYAFCEIIANHHNGQFVVDSFTSQGTTITRNLEKAILSTAEGIPYLAPEIKLLMISHPAYMTSSYHKQKNRIDFDSTIPFLPKESMNWLIHAMETAYPDGHIRLGQIKALAYSLD